MTTTNTATLNLSTLRRCYATARQIARDIRDVESEALDGAAAMADLRALHEIGYARGGEALAVARMTDRLYRRAQ